MIRKTALFFSICLLFAGQAFSQNSLLSLSEILQTLPGNWVIDPIEDPDTETNCEDNFLSIELHVEGNRVVYTGQWSDSTEVYRSDVSQIDDDAGQVLPTILLQYDNEVRLDENGELVSWALFMPDRDHFYWTRRDWPYGRRTAMRRRCPDTALVG